MFRGCLVLWAAGVVVAGTAQADNRSANLAQKGARGAGCSRSRARSGSGHRRPADGHPARCAALHFAQKRLAETHAGEARITVAQTPLLTARFRGNDIRAYGVKLQPLRGQAQPLDLAVIVEGVPEQRRVGAGSDRAATVRCLVWTPRAFSDVHFIPPSRCGDRHLWPKTRPGVRSVIYRTWAGGRVEGDRTMTWLASGVDRGIRSVLFGVKPPNLLVGSDPGGTMRCSVVPDSEFETRAEVTQPRFPSLGRFLKWSSTTAVTKGFHSWTLPCAATSSKGGK